MIIKMNIDGTIDKTYGSRVFKRSNAVQEIVLFGPFNSQSTILANFVLPDDTHYTEVMTFGNYSIDEKLNMWICKIKHPITEIEGRVNLSFEIRTIADTQEITTTAETYINVEKSNSNVVVDEVDQFFELANEGIVRAQQALNHNETQDTRLAALEEENGTQNNRLTDLETTSTDHESRITDNESTLESHGTRLTTVEIKVTNLENTSTSHGNTLTNHGSRIETLETDNTANKNNIQTLMGSIKSITDNGDDSYTFTTHDNQTFTINRPSEKYTVSGDWDEENKTIVMTFNDGSKTNIPVDEIYTHIQAKIQELNNQDVVHQGLIDDLLAFKDDISPRMVAVENTVTVHEARVSILESDNTVNKTDIEEIKGKLDRTFTAEEKAKLQNVPEPKTILTTDKATMSESYKALLDKDLMTKEDVVKLVEGATGVDLSMFATSDDLELLEQDILGQIKEPSIQEFTYDQPITHIEDEILDSPNEIVEIIGRSEPILSETDKEILTWKVNDTLKNELIDDNGQKRINENVGQVTFDGSQLGTIADLGNTIRIYFTDLLHNFDYYISSGLKNNLDLKLNGSSEDMEGYYLYEPSNRFGIKLSKERLNGQTINEYLSQNPLTVTYELAVKNPKTKVIEDGDVIDINTTFYNNVDLIYIKKPLDSKIYNTTNLSGVTKLNGYDELIYPNNPDNVNNVNKFYTYNSNFYMYLIVEKGSYTLSHARDLLRDKTLTYELATPRLAETVGVEHVENPIIKSESPLGEIHELQFNETLKSTLNGLVYDELKQVDGVWEITENVEEVNGEMIVKETPIKRLANWEGQNDLVFSKGHTIYLKSLTNVLPIVKTKCAMDIAAQVKAMIDDGRIKNERIVKNEETLKIHDDKIEDLFNENTQIIEVITENVEALGNLELRVENNEIEIDNHNGRIISLETDNTKNKLDIQALAGAYIIRGNIAKSTAEIVTNPSLLSLYMDNKQKLGDVLIDSNECEWYFNGSEWNNLGPRLVGTASELTEGLVKLGHPAQDNKLPVKMNLNTNQIYVDVTDYVNRITALENFIDTLPESVDNLTLTINGNSTILGESEQTYTVTISPNTLLFNIKWSLTGNGTIVSQDEKTCRVRAGEGSGTITLTVSVTDLYSKTKTTSKSISTVSI